MNKLNLNFYKQDTINLARELLGKKLVRNINGNTLSGIIVETEAYLGGEDPACHSFGYRKTPRTQTMFLPGGHSYVYFIYGMYNCFNVVSNIEGEPEAILIRALEPVEGIEQMRINRPKQKDTNLTSGPGKLCQALQIDKSLNAQSLTNNDIYIEDSSVEPGQIIEGPRIGIGDSHDAVHWPLRFHLKNNPYVSV